MEGKTLLKAEVLTAGYQRQAVIHDVTLGLRACEFIALVGPNGAGKSTLLKALAGLVTPMAGTVRLEDQHLARLKPRDVARRIAYLPQGITLQVPFSVGELVGMSRYAHGGFSDESLVQSVLSRMGLSKVQDTPVTRLSGGMQQRVLIAAALVQTPQILLLDEPLAALDPLHQDETLALLERFAKQPGQAVVAAIHDLNVAVLHATRVIALKSGRIHFDGSPRAFMNNPVLSSLYGKDFLLVEHPVREVPMLLPGI